MCNSQVKIVLHPIIADRGLQTEDKVRVTGLGKALSLLSKNTSAKNQATWGLPHVWDHRFNVSRLSHLSKEGSLIHNIFPPYLHGRKYKMWHYQRAMSFIRKKKSPIKIQNALKAVLKAIIIYQGYIHCFVLATLLYLTDQVILKGHPQKSEMPLKEKEACRKIDTSLGNTLDSTLHLWISSAFESCTSWDVCSSWILHCWHIYTSNYYLSTKMVFREIQHHNKKIPMFPYPMKK